VSNKLGAIHSASVKDTAKHLKMSPRSLYDLVLKWVNDGFLDIQNPSRKARFCRLSKTILGKQWRSDQIRTGSDLQAPARKRDAEISKDSFCTSGSEIVSRSSELWFETAFKLYPK
jgi:hypothetical protein